LTNISHICGSFVFQSAAGFINGSGSEKEGVSEISVPKYIEHKGKDIPYMSAQDFRYSVREVFMREYKKLALKHNITEEICDGVKSVNIIDPVSDVFGYFTKIENPPKKIIPGTNYALVKNSTFKITPPMAIGRKTRFFSLEKGFVHLNDGTPLPYSSKFYWADMESLFGIELNRIGRFTISGDRQEIEAGNLPANMENIIDTQEISTYQLPNYKTVLSIRLEALLKSIVTVYGVAKACQFGTDIAPKVFIFAGQNGGNPILGKFFQNTSNGPYLDIDLLIKAIETGEKFNLFATPVYLGIRNGYLANEEEVMTIPEKLNKLKIKTKVIISSPIQSVNDFLEKYKIGGGE